MQLDNFLHEEKSVKVTGIERGEWFVQSNWGQPHRVWKCASRSVERDGSVGVIYVDPPPDSIHTKLMFSAFQCHKLDAKYTEEQVLVLQARSFKEFATWKQDQQSRETTGRPAIGNMDHLKEDKS